MTLAQLHEAIVVRPATIALAALLLVSVTIAADPAQEENKEKATTPGTDEVATTEEPPGQSDVSAEFTSGESVPIPRPEESNSAQGQSLTSSMSADSGVSVQTLCTNCNNADLSISGMGNEHVTVVCDGIPVPSGLGQIYLLSVMPPSRINKVAVSKGASDPAHLGGAVGGGIEIERHEPSNGVQLNASADAGSYDWRAGRLDISGQTGWFGGYGVASWSESDRIDANGDGWANLPAFERYTVDVGVDLNPARGHRIQIGRSRYNEDQVDGPAAAYEYERRTCEGLDAVLFGIGCVDETGIGYNREDVQLNRDQADFRYDYQISPGTSFSATAMVADRKQDIQETNNPTQQSVNLLTDEELQELGALFFFPGTPPEEIDPDEVAQMLEDLGLPIGEPDPPMADFPSYQIEDEAIHGALGFSRSIGQQATLRAGASINGTAFEVIDTRLNLQRTDIPGADYPIDTQLKEKLREHGIYVEGDTAIGSRLEFSAGIRYVEYQYTDNEAEINERLNGVRSAWLEVPLPEGGRWVPRAALTWKVTDDVQLRFSGGAGFRAPAPAFDRVCCGRQYRGNRGVQLEESKSAGVEVIYQTGPRYRVSGSVFVTDFDNFIVNLATDSNEWMHTYQNANIVKARNTAVNFEGRFQPLEWMTISASYSWLDPENRAPNGDITLLFDKGGALPEERTFSYDGVPYTTESRGALGLNFNLPPAVTMVLATQYTGPTLIQSFNNEGINFGVNRGLSTTEDFWVSNLRISKLFQNGITVYGGIDNIHDYVQGGGCTGPQAEANPSLVGCLGDPRYDFNWGPLRGRYYYVGVGYNFATAR